MSLRLGYLINRYWVVTLLPSVVVYSIYSDYTRTQRYKANKLKDDQASN